ncbi:hypothetical protein HanIR_Chr13g0663861 [Helianthus annuus]|nr:hypothetical protein HanIR_Chr13g0663861 [Helianthus annuus]
MNLCTRRELVTDSRDLMFVYNFKVFIRVPHKVHIFRGEHLQLPKTSGIYIN